MLPCIKGPCRTEDTHLASRQSQPAGLGALILWDQREQQFSPPGHLTPGALPPAQFLVSTVKCTSGEITSPRDSFQASLTLLLQLNNSGPVLDGKRTAP